VLGSALLPLLEWWYWYSDITSQVGIDTRVAAGRPLYTALCCMLYAVGFSPQYVASSYVDDYQLPATQYVVRKTYYIVRTTYYFNRSPGPGGGCWTGRLDRYQNKNRSQPLNDTKPSYPSLYASSQMALLSGLSLSWLFREVGATKDFSPWAETWWRTQFWRLTCILALYTLLNFVCPLKNCAVSIKFWKSATKSGNSIPSFDFPG